MSVEILEITLKNPKKLSEQRKVHWAGILFVVKGVDDAQSLIFLAEILEILENGGKCDFLCKKFSGPDMFGGYDLEWEMKTANFRLARALTCEISESWQRVETSVDSFEKDGFKNGLDIEWDGKTSGLFPMEIIFKGLPEEKAELIIKSANELFETVNVRRLPPSATDRAEKAVSSPQPPKGSAQWDRFYESFFGDPYMAWHDGLDMNALLSLEGEERERAEKMLLESSDSRAIEGLGALKSLKALEKITDVAKISAGQYAAKAYQALNKIKPDNALAKPIINEMKNASYWNDRMEAAIVLRDFKTPEVIGALYEAVANDPEYLVRYHAACSLLSIHSFSADITSYQDIFSNIVGSPKGPITEADKMKFERAAAQLKEMFSKK